MKNECQIENLSEEEDLEMKNKQKLRPKSKRSKSKRGWIVDLRRTHYKILKQIVEGDLQWKILKEGSDIEPNIIWSDFYVSEDEVNSLLPFQKINHFPSSFQLGNKTFLTKNISRMKKKYPDQYKFFPESWQLPEELQLFKYQKEKRKGVMCILKPANLCQGKGITITSNADIIQQKVKQTRKQYVVQHYIENPYLIDNLKFDLRLYVLVRSLKPLEIYIYQDGLARFATTNYKKPSKSNITDNFMHLTNFAINKKNPVFCDEQETGHKRRFSTVLDSLSAQGKDVSLIMSKIIKSIVLTIISVQPKLSHLYATSAPSKFARGKNCFEIFGFDFLLDQTLNPYLLEVNHTPSFRVSSDVDKEIKRNLLKDTLLQLYNKPKKEIWSQNYVWDTKKSLNYLQIYPTSDETDPYQEIIDHSQLLFDCWTGVKKDNKQKRLNSQKYIATQPQSPKPKPKVKHSISGSKPPRFDSRPFTAAQFQNLHQGKRLQKTMTTFDYPFQIQTVNIPPNRLVNSYQKRTMSAATKKHSINSVKSKVEEKKLACMLYDFMERNIDMGIAQPMTEKEDISVKRTKKVLLKSFNSKNYKNARSKNFYDSCRGMEQ